MDNRLAKRCPVCSAAPGGKCLEPNGTGWGGMHYIEEPHPSRYLNMDTKPVSMRVQE